MSYLDFEGEREKREKRKGTNLTVMRGQFGLEALKRNRVLLIWLGVEVIWVNANLACD